MLPAGTSSVTPSLWQDLRAALRGTQADYTRIPLKRAVFLLAIPMMLELVLESTFAVVDIFFVARLGASAVATVGLTETYLFLLYSVAMGLAMAVTAIIARRIGEKRGEEAAVERSAAFRVIDHARFDIVQPDALHPRRGSVEIAGFLAVQLNKRATIFHRLGLARDFAQYQTAQNAKRLRWQSRIHGRYGYGTAD